MERNNVVYVIENNVGLTKIEFGVGIAAFRKALAFANEVNSGIKWAGCYANARLTEE